MNKRDIIKRVSGKTGFTNENAAIAVTAMIEVLTEAMYNEEKIQLQDIGIFELKEMKPRVVRNPRTGEPVEVPSKKSYKFKPAANIKRQLNG